MYNFFIGLFGALIALAFFFQYATKEQGNSSVALTQEFKSFQQNWLTVYYIVMGADWLQGPYVYALYKEYGFEKSDIGKLFIAGFLSSLVFGTVAGALADKYGRKRLCLVFSLAYSVSCLTKLVNDYQILMLGRILSGIATSLLFSSFESWMVSEHKARNFPSELLSETFGLATFGNGVIAIAAGLVATAAADYSSYHYAGPFIVALLPLALSAFIVATSWSENYGDSTVEIVGTFTNAFQAFQEDHRVPILGMIQSLFEGSMYTFVFMWTPALTAGMESADDLPFGLIFACFMVCIMIGSSLFGVMMSKWKMRPESIAVFLLAVAAVALLVPVFTSNMVTLLLSFLVFEVCCGVYFPCLGTLRGKYLPESTRSAVMNFFRIPLNALVVVILLQVGNMKNSTVFVVCSFWLAIAWFLQVQLSNMPPRAVSSQDEDSRVK